MPEQLVLIWVVFQKKQCKEEKAQLSYKLVKDTGRDSSHKHKTGIGHFSS